MLKCGGLVAPPKYIALILWNLDWDLIFKRDLCRCNQIKDLKMRPTQVNLLGPKSRDKYPRMRQNLKDKYTEEEAMKTEAEFDDASTS